jgi:prepilin-type N-terminal cleavage/methylation domain-containing protein
MTPRYGSQAGFSLVELLVGLALFGLIASTSLAAFQGGARLWNRGADRADATSRVAAAQALLRRQWEAAVPLTDADGRGVAFLGGAERIVWVGRRPGQALPGGLYVLSLGMSGTGSRLLLGWRRLDPALPLAAHEAEERVTVMDGVAAARLDYFGGGDDGRAAWRPGWGGGATLPRLIRLQLTPQPGAGWDWPALVVAVGFTVAGWLPCPDQAG